MAHSLKRPLLNVDGDGGEEGQMVVEMAVVAPVMIVAAVIALNLMGFLEASARFDRVAPDIVLALAVAPEGEASDGGQVHRVTEALQGAMGGSGRVRVSAWAEGAWESGEGGGVGFSFAPHLTRYVCTMAYAPWPQSFSVAGVEAGAPLELRHDAVVVVDRYRSGIVV